MAAYGAPGDDLMLSRCPTRLKLRTEDRSLAWFALACFHVAVAPDEMILDSIRGKGFPVRDWLTSFPLLMVALDPFTNESAWILDRAATLLRHFQPADVRTAFLVAGSDDECRQFLGPLAEEFLTFSDPKGQAIADLGIAYLPALAVVRPNLELQTADGWNPTGWHSIVEPLADILSWSLPLIPAPNDPAPFRGTPAKFDTEGATA